jgi:hypothetical protein
VERMSTRSIEEQKRLDHHDGLSNMLEAKRET